MDLPRSKTRAVSAAIVGLAALVMSTLPAVAATNVTISGVVVDANGEPAAGVRVQTRYSPSHSITDATGHFSFPVEDDVTTQLTIIANTGAAPQEGWLQMFGPSRTISGNWTVGTVTLPRFNSSTVRVLDDNGTPVYGASVGTSLEMGPDWADAGHQLTPDMAVESAFYYINRLTQDNGEISIGYPRMTDGGLPPQPVHVTSPSGASYSANLSDATGTGPFAVTISGYTVGPPTTPAIGGVYPGNGQVDVAFYPGSASNGARVTGYTITATPGGISKTVTDTFATLTGLTNGTTYTVTVKAHSSAGDSTSAPSAAFTPKGPPPPPKNVTAVGGDRQITVNWDTPDATGSPITQYSVDLVGGGTQVVGPEARSVTFTGLNEGFTYTARVSAFNADGFFSTVETSARTTAPTSVPTTTTAPPPPPAPPAAPTPVVPPGKVSKPTAKVRGTTVILTWKAPTPGSSPITGYRVTRAPGKKTYKTTTRRLTLRRLNPGIYRFKVRAISTDGTGSASVAVKATIR